MTYDLVNEVLRDCDVPPCLGAMDSDWDRIDYDGSYFFYSDKILELRDEYQKDVTFSVPIGADFKSSWPLEDKHMEDVKKYIPSLIYGKIITYFLIYTIIYRRQKLLLRVQKVQLLEILAF